MHEHLRAIVTTTLSDDELAALAAEAKAAALAEVREQLRLVYIEQILSRLAPARTDEVASLSAPATARHGDASLPAPAALGIATDPASAVQDAAPAGAASRLSDLPTAPDESELAAELAALKAQLVTNRAWLEEGKPTTSAPSPVDDEQAPDAPSPTPLLAHSLTHPVSHSPSHLLWVYAVRRAGSPLPDLPGIAPGEPLQAVVWADLEALVSVVPADEFAAEPLEANVRDLEWLEPIARAHQQTLSAMMHTEHPAHFPLVPMRFATLFAGPERVAFMLAERAEALRATLDYLAGRSEWGFKLFVQEQVLAERLADASPAVRELREAIAAKPAGAAYMLQKRLERLAADEARRVSDTAAETLHSCLSAAAVAAERSPLREAQGETMLLNSAYLVAHEAQAAFAAALEAAHNEYAALGFRLELTGPWPPYTFAGPPALAVEAALGGEA